VKERSLPLAIILGVAVPILLTVGYLRAQYVKETLTWPTAMAVIDECTVTRSYLPRSIRMGNFSFERKYDVRISYSYSVGGLNFQGRSDTTHGLADADRKAEKYSSGTQHTVYYDPTAPRRSLLERTTLATDGIAIAIACGVVMPIAFSLFAMALFGIYLVARRVVINSQLSL
jgi:hypothetical protein